MPRDKNPKETVKITLSTTPRVAESLDRLIPEGLYGQTRATVAESLLREKIRQLIREGELKQGGQSE
jgi:hypothetical protein